MHCALDASAALVGQSLQKLKQPPAPPALQAELQQIADDYKAGLYKQQGSEADDYADWT